MYPYILSCDTFNVHYTVSLEFIRVTELSDVGEYSHNRHGINYLFDNYCFNCMFEDSSLVALH